MRKFKAKAANKLRNHIMIMLILHCVFILLEIFVYDIIIMLISLEILYIWVAFQGYMTLNDYAIYGYIILMFLAPIGVLKIFDVDGAISMLLYVL